MRLFSLAVVFFLLGACAEKRQDIEAGRVDVLQRAEVVGPDASCLEWLTFFCPPWDAVNTVQVQLDTCTGEVVDMGECLPAHECDPFSPIYKIEPCTTPEGFPGEMVIHCDKGTISPGPCESPCSEEICNGIDDDCDGDTDEGTPKNACGDCVPLELVEYCDALDNDCNGQTDEGLTLPCSTECGQGLVYCVEGAWSSCDADVPQIESCNGADDDCDGQIDEGLFCTCPPEMIGTLVPCVEPPLVCGLGYKGCECFDPDCQVIGMSPCLPACYHVGSLPCDSFEGMPMVEVCNDYDDDCDGEVDEGIAPMPCYTGPPSTEGVGECIAGALDCVAGSWGSFVDGAFIAGLCPDVPPAEEVCNGADDNCDGITEPLEAADLLFVLDLSGSMGDEIDAVLSAVSSYAQSFAAEKAVQFGLVVGPAAKPSTFGNTELLILAAPLGPIDGLVHALSFAPSLMYMTSGLEMLVDALYLSLAPLSPSPPVDPAVVGWISNIDSDPAPAVWDVGWRPDADPIVVLMTDEDPQSYLSPFITPDDVLAVSMGASLYAFTPEGLGPLWAAYGMTWQELSADPATLYAALTAILDAEACQ